MLRTLFLNISRYCGTAIKTGRAALGCALLASVFVVNPAHAGNGFVFTVNCAACQTSADFVSAAVSAAQARAWPGTYVVTSVTYPATAYVNVAGTIFIGPMPQMKFYLLNITTTLVDASGSSLAGQSEATLEATFAAIDLMIFGNIRKSGAINGVIKIPPNYGTTPINSETWEVDSSNGIGNALWTTLGVDQGNLPMGTLVSVVWQDGTTAQFVRTNSVPTLQWVYVPGSMKNKNGQPITPVSGTTILNPNPGGTGGGASVPGVPAPRTIIFLGSKACVGEQTFQDGTGAIYVYDFFIPC